MTDDELIAALRTLKPTSQLPGMALFMGELLERAGIDLDHLDRWASAHGGGAIQAGRLKVRKGEAPERGKLTGRPQGFYAVPTDLLD